MNRLEIILQSKTVLIILSAIAFGYGIYYKLSPTKSNYQEGDTSLTITVESYKIHDSQVTIEGKAEEPLTIYMNLKTEEERETFQELVSVGDKLQVTGTLKELTNQTYPNLFSYKEYANGEGKFYTMELVSYQKVKSTWRSYLYRWFHKYDCKYTDAYFFLNSQTLPESLQEVNWTPFFSMYSLLLRPFQKKKKWYVSMLLLLALTTNFAPKVLALLFLCYLRTHHISFANSLYLTLLFRVMLEPNILFTSTFFYIGIIYGTLVIFIRNRIHNQIVIAYILNFVTLPIFVSQNFYFHPLLFFFQPFILYAIRLGFIGVLFNTILPCQFVLNPYFESLTAVAETLNSPSFLKISLAKLSIPFLILCYLCMAVFLLGIVKRKGKYIVPILLFALLHYLVPNLLPRQDVFYLDVGQGDATLIRIDHKTILIDTAGIMGIGTIEESRTEQLVTNKLIPFFRSLGISKIDYLIITHGDYDHIGGASFLVKEFPIGMVFLNSNNLNEQERNLIQLLQKKKICYRQVSKLQIQTTNSTISLFSLDEEDENAASIITTLEYQNRVLLFLADATINATKNYLATANVSNVDVLKVAHHGSKNNTDEEIIQEITPQVAIFSAGRNNLYNHPSPILVKQLENYQIPYFSTATDGTIHFCMKKRLFQTNPA